MKALIFFIPLFLCLSSAAQFYIGAEAGRTNLNYTFGLKFGYRNYYNFVGEGSIIGHLDQVNPFYLSGSLGYWFKVSDKFAIVPLAGYTFSCVSAEQKWRNANLIRGELRFHYKGVYIGFTANKQTPQLSIGFSGFHWDSYNYF